MGIKWIFGILAVGVLAQLAGRWLASRQFMTGHRRMNPAEILRWRLANGEIDRFQYEFRIRRLHEMVREALSSKGEDSDEGM